MNTVRTHVLACYNQYEKDDLTDEMGGKLLIAAKSIHGALNKLTLLERRMVTQKFWSAKRNRELFFVSAPLQYGKTTAVLSALENRKYLYIRLDPCLSDTSHFCSHVINCLNKFDAAIPAGKTTDEDLLIALGKARSLDALVFDDLQLCVGEEVTTLLARIYRMHGSEIQMILISRSTLPYCFMGCRIVEVTEEALAFSDTEIKKLAEQNRLRISGAHARRLAEQSAGCIGFIEEELRLGDRCNMNGELPDTIRSCIGHALSVHLPGSAANLLSELAIADELPLSMGQQFDAFSRDTGLIREKNGALILHPLLKLRLKSRFTSGHEAYMLLVSNNAYIGALKYAVAAGSLEDTGEALRNFLTRDLIVPELTFERVYNLFGGTAPADEAINFFICLFEHKCGSSESIGVLLSMGKRYTGCLANLKAHVFTSPYPHINAEYGFEGGADELLIKCGGLCDELNFSGVLELLNQARGEYEGAAKLSWYCLLIDTMRNLHMYAAAERELLAFEKWTDENPEYRVVFEDYQARLLILDGDIPAAEEWLSARCIPLTARIYRSNIDNIITDALAFIVIGEPQSAMVRLRNASGFAEKYGIKHISIESHALLALAYQKNRQTDTAVTHMEKALTLAGLYRKPAVIGSLGKDAAYLVERCFSRSKKKGENNDIACKLLLHLKNNKTRGGMSAKELNISLSERQTEILTMLSESYTYSQIAEAANIRITTVRDHIKKLYEKLEVRNSADAIVKAKENGLL